MTIEKLDKSDELVETLKSLTIKNAGYYVSESTNANDAKCNPASNPKTVTHTSYRKKNVTDTSNRILQQKLLISRTLPIVTTTMNPWIYGRILTFGGTPHIITTPTTK